MLQIVRTSSDAHPTFCSMGTGHDVAECKNEWISASTAAFLHDVGRQNFIDRVRTIYGFLVSRLRFSGVIPPLPIMRIRSVSEENFANLDAFAKMRKATFSFVMSVRPSAWKNSVPTGRIFTKFDI